MLLTTKTTVPHAKADTLYRERLLTLLRNNLDKMLVLIIADAGYGKTTLLAQAVKEARLPCLFYDLDKNDSDLMVFYSYLVYAIKQIDPALVKYSTKLLKSATADGAVGKNVELLFGTLINELYEKQKEELFVILDNYHNIAENSAVHDALDFFIDRLPEKVHVIISSRSVPPLPSRSRWRAKQDLFEITREDLAFTVEDVASLLKDAYKTSLSDEDIRQMTEHTEGWITGIQLILQSAGRDKTTVSESLQKHLDANQPMDEYFANEILSMESPEMQDFLTKCSVLDVMTAGACDAVMEMNDSQQMLKRLGKRFLFVSSSLPDEYKCHPLFREFLQGRLKDEETVLHRKAAEYYKRNGKTEQAIEHFLAAKDYSKAGMLICRIADEMAMKARFNTLDDWYQRMPEEAFIKQPELLAHISSLRMAQGRLDESEARCSQAIPLLEKTGKTKPLALALLEQAKLFSMRDEHGQALKVLNQALKITGQFKRTDRFGEQVKGAVLNSKALIWMKLGDYKKAKIFLLQAKHLRYYITNPYEFIIAESNLALIYASQGEENLAYDVYRNLIPQISGKYIYKIGGIFLSAATTAIAHGNDAWAEQTLKQGRALCQPFDDPWSKAYIQYGYGILYLQKARWELALHHLNEAVDGATHLGLSKLRFVALRDISRGYRYQGEYARSQEYLDKALAATGEKPSQISVGLRIEQSLLDGCKNDFKKAGRLAQESLMQARKLGGNRLVFMSLLAAAILYAEQGKPFDGFGRLTAGTAQGKKKRAISCLRQAVRLAKLKGYDGALIREMRASPKLIDLAQKRRLEPDYLGRILSECERYGPATEELSLHARLLGGFELAEGGVGRKILLKRKATRAILAFFLLHPEKGFSWEEIAAWAWPESSAKSAHHLFKNALWEIHRGAPVLKTAVEYKDNHYTLRPDLLMRVDANEFHDAVVKATAVAETSEKIRLLEQAVALYRGLLLPGFYYQWADDLRNAYEEEYTRALAHLAQAYFTNCEYEKSAESCLRYIKTDEVNEDIHRLLLADYIKLGLKTKALKHYANLKKTLRKQLHAAPSAETASLIQTLF